MTSVEEVVRARVRDVADFPTPGVVFKDITPLLADPDAFGAVVDAIAASAGPVDKVVGIEARGFVFAAPVAHRLRAGFVPVRKSGKLPAETYEKTYELEYGTATLAVHTDAFAVGDRVLVVDDVLATGGTVAATAELVGSAGATVSGCAVVIELGFLGGRERLAPLPVSSLVVY